MKQDDTINFYDFCCICDSELTELEKEHFLNLCTDCRLDTYNDLMLECHGD